MDERIAHRRELIAHRALSGRCGRWLRAHELAMSEHEELSPDRTAIRCAGIPATRAEAEAERDREHRDRERMHDPMVVGLPRTRVKIGRL